MDSRSVSVRTSDRFWAKVRKTDSCWEWTGTKKKTGYGLFYVGPRGGAREIRAHRFAYEELVGPIPEDMEIDHLCQNEGCVNPDHLEAVTPGENKRRARMCQVISLTCKYGHPRSERWAIWGKAQALYCKECHRLKSQSNWATWNKRRGAY